PRDVDVAVRRVDVDVLVVGELAVRAARRSVALVRRDLDEATVLPREAAVIGSVEQERDVERRGEVERLADVVRDLAVGAERDRRVAACVVGAGAGDVRVVRVLRDAGQEPVRERGRPRLAAVLRRVHGAAVVVVPVVRARDQVRGIGWVDGDRRLVLRELVSSAGAHVDDGRDGDPPAGGCGRAGDDERDEDDGDPLHGKPPVRSDDSVTLTLEQQLRHHLERLGLRRADDQRRHRRLFPSGEAVGDALLRADERDGVDEIVGDRLDRLALSPAEVELLDARRVRFPAVARDECVVEVLALRAHAADVQREGRLERVAQRLDVVTDEDVCRCRDLEAVRRRRERVAEALRRHEDRQPAVGDLVRERDVLRADRGEVDRDVGPQRSQHQLERLSEPGRAGAVVRDAVVLALVLDHVAPQRRPNDLDILTRLHERLAPRLAVPALYHLRPGRPEPEQEAAAGHEVERGCRHRRIRRRATGDLHDRRADLDAARARRHPREHRHGIRSPRLRGPHRVVAEALRLLHERDERRRVRSRGCVGKVEAELHWADCMPHPELASEQAYVDNAYARLDKMRTTLEGSQDRMATEFAAVAMEAWLKRRRRTFQDAERGLCFGRLTLDGALRPLYVGRRWVHDDAHEALVVNWQAPAARPFYTATPSDPQRVTQRRRFRTEGRRLVDISDEALDGSGVEGATVSDFLLEELDRRREGRMRDIVATIQSDQYRLITAEPEGALIVQGGPGTGKTAVGL